MSANVETMFYVREKPWHGLGTQVNEAPTSSEALIYAGLDWQVTQKDVYTEDCFKIHSYKAALICYPTVFQCLSTWFRTSQPFSVTRTRSSTRTPNLPGR